MRFLYWALAFLSVAALTLSKIPAADTWWHLAAGREIWEQGRLLQHDPFSFTAGQAFWFNHEWLAEIGFYLTAKVGGLNALYFLRTVLVFAAFAWIPLASHQNRGLFSALFPVLALYLGQAQVFLDARAYLITYVGLSLTIYFVDRFLVDQNRKWLWLGIAIVVPWANCHGAYLLGPVVWGIAFTSQLLQKSENWKPFLATLLGSLLASLLNPYTYHIWLFPFSLWEHPVYKAHLNEWQRPELLGSHAPYLILVAITLVALWKSKASGWHWLLSLSFLALGFLGWRHCTLAALVACHTVTRCLPRPEDKLSELERGTLMVVGIVASLFFVHKRWDKGPESWTLLHTHFPVQAAQLLKESPELPRRIINPYEWGGYLAWELGTSYQTYIDGRAHTLFPDQTYLDSLILQYGGTTKDVSYLQTRTREEILDDLGAELVLTTKLLGKQYQWMMKHSGQWALLFEDQNSALFLRRSPQLVEKISERLKEPGKAVFYASRFQGTPMELTLLKRAIELAKSPQEREQLEALLQSRISAQDP